MIYLDLSFPTPAENLACDEALLDFCDEANDAEILRIWEPEYYFVVVGYANKVETEVNKALCGQKNIPILRRCSGGGTVLQGAGCLNYSLILNVSRHSSLQTIHGTNHYIMERHRELFQNELGRDVEIAGHTDLAIGGLKFSGNAQRRKRHCLLFHGTFLLSMDLTKIEELLKMPSKQPEYRENRLHKNFLTNVPIASENLKSFLRNTWQAELELKLIPQIGKALMEKYHSAEWNFKF